MEHLTTNRDFILKQQPLNVTEYVPEICEPNQSSQSLPCPSNILTPFVAS